MKPGSGAGTAFRLICALLAGLGAIPSYGESPDLFDSLAALAWERNSLKAERSRLEIEQTRVESEAATERRSLSIAPAGRITVDGRSGGGLAGKYAFDDFEAGAEGGNDPLTGGYLNLDLGYSISNGKKALREAYSKLARLQGERAKLEIEAAAMRDISYAFGKAADTYFLSRERAFLAETAASVDSVLDLVGKIIRQGYAGRIITSSLVSFRSEIDLGAKTIDTEIEQNRRSVSRRIHVDSGFVSSLSNGFPAVMARLGSRIRAIMGRAGACYRPLQDRIDSLDNDILRQRIAILKRPDHNVVVSIGSQTGENVSDFAIVGKVSCEWSWLKSANVRTSGTGRRFCLDPASIGLADTLLEQGKSDLMAAEDSLNAQISGAVQEIKLGSPSGAYRLSELFARKLSDFQRIEERRKSSVYDLIASITDFPLSGKHFQAGGGP